MAYVEDGNVVIHAFHEDEMEGIFKRLEIWEDFTVGEMRCIVCDRKLSRDNFGALVPYKGGVRGACDKCSCISKAQRLVEDGCLYPRRKIK